MIECVRPKGDWSLPRLTSPTGEVGEALERVLESDTFARSGRARDLLHYLVSREQTGEGDALKGYSIALDVFGRDEAFDPSTESVVRVQARRLRDLLNEYYRVEGAADRLRIDIPRGSYVPSYSHMAGAVPDAPPLRSRDEDEGDDVSGGLPPEAPQTVLNGQRARPRTVWVPASMQRDLRFVWIAMSAVVIMLGFVAYKVGFGDAEMLASRPGVGSDITSAVSPSLPTIHVEADPSAEGVDRVAAILRGALAGFDTIDYVARPYSDPPSGDESGAVFLFQISQVPGESDVRIELRHAPTARILATREVDPARADDMIADLLTSIAPASGVIYAYISNNGLATPLTDCLLKNDYYYRDPGEELFVGAYDCMTALEDAGVRSPLIYSELASLELQGIVNRYDHAKEFTREGAMECARRAIQMGPASPYAHRAYGYLLQRLGNDSEGLAWMRKAYDLNPYDLSMAASYAYALVFSGHYGEGAPILERAVRASSAHPSWWDYSLFLVMFMLGEKEKAANATLALAPTRRAHYLAARMVVAHQAGNTAEADELRSLIIEQYPQFAADPRSFFTRAQYPKDLTDKFIEAISDAGLVSAS
jgi:tetratricopeptide (TPR) repeat protein